MKKLLIISCTLLISIGVNAQSTDDVNLIQSIWGKEKRVIVQDYMILTPEEVMPFWEDYDAYELSRKDLGKDRIAILQEYADNFETLTDDKAADLINRGIANNIAIQKLAQKTFKKMSKSISSLKAARFIQLENYFLVSIQMYILESIPFVGELDDMMIEK